ncbi:MAG: transposase [Micrococcaceae bacterium]|nr:transposase [Micrococcaceae bacterium]
MANYKYPQELRERATRLCLEARRDPETHNGAVARIANQVGVHKEALRSWVKKAEQEQLPVEDEDAQAVIRRQAKEIRELQTSLDILTSATAFFGKAEFDRRLK